MKNFQERLKSEEVSKERKSVDKLAQQLRNVDQTYKTKRDELKRSFNTDMMN